MFMASGEDNQVTIWDIAVEADTPEAVEGVPPQLMFLHLGQKEVYLEILAISLILLIIDLIFLMESSYVGR